MLLLQGAPEWCWATKPLHGGLTGLPVGTFLAHVSSSFRWKRQCREWCCIPDPHTLAWSLELGRGFLAELMNWGGCGLHQDLGVLKNISLSSLDPVKVKVKRRSFVHLQSLIVSEQKGTYLGLCKFVLAKSHVWNSGWLGIGTAVSLYHSSGLPLNAFLAGKQKQLSRCWTPVGLNHRCQCFSERKLCWTGAMGIQTYFRNKAGDRFNSTISDLAWRKYLFLC